MPWWLASLLEAAKLWQTQAAVAVLIVIAVLALVTVRWVRCHHRRTLILMRGVAIHMIQNRPPTDDATRLQQNLNWWETEILKILPKAGAKPGEIVQFEALGNIYPPTVIAEKIARLDAIVRRMEGQI